jgi:V/A-type H+-transporting ATPase subunit E
MSSELQNLLDKIQREGVDKAKADAAEITAQAKSEAAEIVKTAKDEASQEMARAKAEQEAYAQRASETIRQAARDTILEVENAIRTLLENLLTKNGNEVMSSPEAVKPLILEAINTLASGNEAEISANEKLVDALRSDLANMKNIKVVMDELTGNGFSIKLDGGRVEHDFTSETIASALAKRLRPALAKLVK